MGRIGDDLRMDYTAVGDTTNLAARMQQTARPGSVMITEATHRIVEGFFETLDHGRLEVKGHDPVRAFEVLRPRSSRSRIDIGHERGLTPFVGRERELGVLLERFEDVAAGRGQVVFIGGDAGIGKSRLLYEFRRALTDAGHGVTWLEGQCVSFGQSIPFLPLVDQLRKNFGSRSSTASRRSSPRSSTACARWAASTRTRRSSAICSRSIRAMPPSRRWTRRAGAASSSRRCAR